MQDVTEISAISCCIKTRSQSINANILHGRHYCIIVSKQEITVSMQDAIINARGHYLNTNSLLFNV